MGFRISIEGAKPEEIAKGIAAAQAVFYRAGVTPLEAATARFNVEGWDVRGFDGPISDGDLEICGVWDAADQAAAQACCEHWGRKPASANLELVYPASDNGDGCELKMRQRPNRFGKQQFRWYNLFARSSRKRRRIMDSSKLITGIAGASVLLVATYGPHCVAGDIYCRDVSVPRSFSLGGTGGNSPTVPMTAVSAYAEGGSAISTSADALFVKAPTI